MSVINQMLKDLDSRTAEQHGTASHPYIPAQAKSPTKVIILTVFTMLCLTVLAFLVWQMYQENQALKQQAEQAISTTMAVKSVSEQAAEQPNSSQPAAQVSESNLRTQASGMAIEAKPQPLTEAQPIQLSPQPEFAAPQTLEQVEVNYQDHKAETIADHGHQHHVLPKQQTLSAPPLTKVNQQSFETVPVNNTEPAAKKTSSLTISRKQMSPTALASQKMNKAERALADNEIEQAEALFEEIIMLTPENATARKQLAALWFGRKSYQPALNLLQTGIDLDSTNQEFRLMKARIYLTVGQVDKAYDVLSALRDVEDIEYQSLLANAAQQIGNHSAAAKAYVTLVQLAPQNARSWLGLAIAYDSNSQFSEAISAYNSAINQGGLSSSAIAFAKQRMEELGE